MHELDIETRGEVMVVACKGEVTYENIGALRQAVEKGLAGGGQAALVLDLSGVGFMDSSGIGTLVALNSKVFSAGKKMYLMAPAEQVMKTLELVKLVDFFDFVNDLGELDLITY